MHLFLAMPALFCSLTLSSPASVDVEIRVGGSSWATIDDDGTIRIGGTSVGKFESNGTVRKSGSSIGTVESDGTIRRGGSSIGKIQRNGIIRRSGSQHQAWSSVSPFAWRRSICIPPTLMKIRNHDFPS